MEEKKFDKNSIIGFALIFIIVMYMMFNSQKEAQKEEAEKAKIEQINKVKKAKEAATKTIEKTIVDTTIADTAKLQKLQSSLGAFAFSATLPSAKNDFKIIENDLVFLKISNKGGYIIEAKLKKFEKFKKGSGQMVELINNNNASFNLELHTKDNRILNTKDLFFEPTLTTIDGNQVLSMKLKASQNAYLEYLYVIKPNQYMIDFDIKSQGLNQVLNTSKSPNIIWDLKAYRNEKSITYEDRYTEIYFEHKDGKISYTGVSALGEEDAEKTTFIAYKQHFFSSILLTSTPFNNL
jgi:YidC/Oxa1 family membrane protein insertase